MTIINPLYLAHQRQRFMRPDAHRFLRPDWRRFARADSELASYYESIERKYRPDQARMPAGSREGGQWTDEEGGGSTTLSAARNKGHHYVSQSVYKKYPLPAEARKVLEDGTTGKLYDRRSNRYDEEHRAYNDAVRREVDKFLRENNIQAERMKPDEARAFLKRVLESSDVRIRNYNTGILMREIRLKLLKALRRGE